MAPLQGHRQEGARCGGWSGRANWRNAITSLGAHGGGRLYAAGMSALADNEDDLRAFLEQAAANKITIYVIRERVKLEPHTVKPKAIDAAVKLLQEDRDATVGASTRRAEANRMGVATAVARKNQTTEEKLAIARELWPDQSLSAKEIADRSGLSVTTLYGKLGKRELPPSHKKESKKSDGFSDLSG